MELKEIKNDGISLSNKFCAREAYASKDNSIRILGPAAINPTSDLIEAMEKINMYNTK